MISIVMATYNRAHLLQRSLMAYEKSTFKDFEIILVDDWSSDNTNLLAQGWANRLNIIYLRPPYKLPGEWRSEASIINIGLRASQGELIIATHPEIIPGRQSLERMWEHRRPSTWHTCKPYFLTVQQQRQIDNCQWLLTNTAVRTLPGFYTEELNIPNAGDAFDHDVIDRTIQWESWQFSGALRETWRMMGGMFPFKTWGSVDMWLAASRGVHGIDNHTEVHPETLVIHQNHETGTAPTPRGHDLFKTLEGIPLTAEELW